MNSSEKTINSKQNKMSDNITIINIVIYYHMYIIMVPREVNILLNIQVSPVLSLAVTFGFQKENELFYGINLLSKQVELLKEEKELNNK